MDTPTQSNILLVPRPLQNPSSRLLLLPLLPSRKPYPPLPAEVWSLIFFYALDLERKAAGYRYVGAKTEANEYVSNPWELDLLRICKGFTVSTYPFRSSNK
jgi:hypothetical protein